MPSHLSTQQKANITNEVIQVLGLWDIRHQVIGDEDTRGYLKLVIFLIYKIVSNLKLEFPEDRERELTLEWNWLLILPSFSWMVFLYSHIILNKIIEF